MKKTIRVFALLMCIVLAFSAFTACEETTTSTSDPVSDTSDGSATNESSFNDDVGFFGYEIPDGVNYNGKTVRVLTLAQYQIKPECNPE